MNLCAHTFSSNKNLLGMMDFFHFTLLEYAVEKKTKIMMIEMEIKKNNKNESWSNFFVAFLNVIVVFTPKLINLKKMSTLVH